MKNMTVFYSDTCGDARNCIYPHRVDLSDPGQREKVFRHDHVLAHFSDGHRGNENFLSADTVGIDVDNEKSDEEADWVTPEDIADMLPDVQYILVPSRHHMMEKGKEGQQKGARPRFHLIFPIDRIFGRTEYESLKRQLAAVFPFADDNALDASRMFFGTPDGLCIVHEGEHLITDYLEQAERETDETYSVVDLQTGIPGERVYETKKVIPLGRRNTTLHRFALQVLTRFGKSEEARKLYREEALCCEQPLSEGELGTIWRSAEKYYDKVVSGQEVLDLIDNWDETDFKMTVEDLEGERFRVSNIDKDNTIFKYWDKDSIYYIDPNASYKGGFFFGSSTGREKVKRRWIRALNFSLVEDPSLSEDNTTENGD